MNAPADQTPPRRRLARAAVVTAIVLLLVAVSLVVLELVLQTTTAWSLYREIQRTPPHPFLQAVPVMAAGNVNRHGFRGDDIEQVKPARTFRIFTIGGSTTLGVTNDYKDSYPFLLQSLLREQHPGVNIEVQNAGCPWYTTAHALVAYMIEVRKFEPDLVIFFEGINDLVRSFSPPWLAKGDFKPDYSHYMGPYARMLGPNAKYVDSTSSWLTWNVIKRWVRGDPDPFDIRDKDNVAKMLARLTQVDRPAFRSLPSFRHYYEAVIHAVQSDGHPIITAAQPFIYRPDLNPDERRMLWFAPLLCAERGTCPSLTAMIHGMGAYNSAAGEISAARGVPFVDFASAVPKTAEYFVDDVHMTKQANAILARMAAEAINSAKMIEKVTR